MNHLDITSFFPAPDVTPSASDDDTHGLHPQHTHSQPQPQACSGKATSASSRGHTSGARAGTDSSSRRPSGPTPGAARDGTVRGAREGGDEWRRGRGACFRGACDGEDGRLCYCGHVGRRVVRVDVQHRVKNLDDAVGDKDIRLNDARRVNEDIVVVERYAEVPPIDPRLKFRSTHQG